MTDGCLFRASHVYKYGTNGHLGTVKTNSSILHPSPQDLLSNEIMSLLSQFPDCRRCQCRLTVLHILSICFQLVQRFATRDLVGPRALTRECSCCSLPWGLIFDDWIAWACHGCYQKLISSRSQSLDDRGIYLDMHLIRNVLSEKILSDNTYTPCGDLRHEIDTAKKTWRQGCMSNLRMTVCAYGKLAGFFQAPAFSCLPRRLSGLMHLAYRYSVTLRLFYLCGWGMNLGLRLAPR